MPTQARRTGLVAQLRQLLELGGVHPARWTAATVVASLALALLDTVGVAAMVPLTQLIGGASTESGPLRLVSQLFGTNDSAILIPLLAASIAGLFLVKSAASIWFRWWLLGTTSVVASLAASELMRRYMLAPYATHRLRRLSDVYWNVNDSTGQAASVLLATVGLVSDLLLLAAIVAVLAVATPASTLLAVAVFAAFVLGLQYALRGRQSRIGEEIADAGREAWGFLLPALDGFREARLTSSAGEFVAGYRRAKLRSARAQRELAIVAEAPRYALEIGFILAIGAIAVLLFTTGTPGDALTVLGVFAAASIRGLPTLNRVASNLAIARTGRSGLQILSDAVVDLDAGGQHDETSRDATPYAGDIALQGVTFRYPDADEPVLRQVSLVVPRNRTMAFVGSSGAGKSTLLDLILGLLEPSEGSIVCGGRSIHDDRATWYSSLGVVSQDVFLLNDTLAANVAFGVPVGDVDRARVEEVIEQARLTDLLAELPRGLDTVVGERGVRLSGGQRQRLGLARALYRRPAVLVLDEATSALDNATEFEITEAIGRLSGRMTIIVVAHRLSTVKGADTLVFLKDGRVEAEGSFAAVRAESEDFARLVELGDLA